jgi:hypothetical protein
MQTLLHILHYELCAYSAPCSPLLHLMFMAALSQNKSPGNTIIFEDLQMEMLGSVLRMPNDVPQRWSSLCKVLQRVLLNWEVLRTYYFRADKTFPLANLK